MAQLAGEFNMNLGVEQLQAEMEKVLNRSMEESDLSAAEVIGTLEIIKQEWIASLFQPEPAQ